MGARILPPVPSFYHRPKTTEVIADQTIGKVFDYIGVEHTRFNRWGENERMAKTPDASIKAL